jgi:eukaryotic-like serine/threonine-protein kinase
MPKRAKTCTSLENGKPISHPMRETLPQKIDHYNIIKSLGKGGMGEVFLASDPLCKRKVALKQIRSDLKDHPIMKKRFLREAQVAAKLTHPSIVPIFSIDPSPEKTYYTMPYVEGETLKKILKQSYEEEKKGEVQHPIGSSILTLTRIFLAVCEAIAYIHSKAIVHRDLKPDNIIVGKYGEVLLLDWGLADFLGRESDDFDSEEEPPYSDLTMPGKVPGTLNYLAPERIYGQSSTASADIYSLGVILYQLLTLRTPFNRISVKAFRSSMHLETLTDPMEIAPYRDVPQHLADIAKRALHFAPEERYPNVDEMILEIKSFLEGKPEWIFLTELSSEKKQDWEFQENILLTKHTAITRSPDIMEWVSLMLSHAPFSGNIKIETKIKIGPENQGVGILIGVPHLIESKEFSEGYCVWFGKTCRLFHSSVEVMAFENAPFEDLTSHIICIEKIDNHLFIYVDNKKMFHYISHVPLTGTHLGVLYKDADFEIGSLTILAGSQSAMINCLAVPDAFLANKQYDVARLEYRKIASSFAGRAEGREAIFRAGITLLEEAKACKKKEPRETLYLLALDEFNKLRHTPAAPLEYLGKSLVYKASKEIEEEIKCLELSLRKYPKHPLLRLIREHITFRLHETSSEQRIAAYHFALLALRYLPHLFPSPNHATLLLSLKKHLEKLPFFLLPDAASNQEQIACELAFWLVKPMTLMEMVESASSPIILSNAMYGLLAMGYCEWVSKHLHCIIEDKEKHLLNIALLYFQKDPIFALKALSDHCPTSPSNAEMRCAYFLFDRSLLDGKYEEALPYFQAFPKTVSLDALHISAALMQNDLSKAQATLESYTPELLSDEYSPLFTPMGCYLLLAEGKEIALSHFSGCIDLPHPPTTMLLSYYLSGKVEKKKGWMAHALAWEKISLLRQVCLYYHCAKDPNKKLEFSKRLQLQLKKMRTL